MKIYGEQLSSRLWLGTARYPSPRTLEDAVCASQAGMVTVSLRREMRGQQTGQSFWALVEQMNVPVLPNTAGCHSVKEAMTTAQMARDVFKTARIKLEIIGDDDTLRPDVFSLVEAAKLLTQEGFQVFPYTTSDIVVAERLIEAGCELLMPMAAAIGSGQGLNDVESLRLLRQRFADIPLVIDAGIGRPSDAVRAMEMGYDAILLNTAVAEAGDPVAMALAFSKAIKAGRLAFEAGTMPWRNMAQASTPLLGRAWL